VLSPKIKQEKFAVSLQSIFLLRAIYKEADVYLLDDPLSAVDAHVGHHLFDRCICQFLADKTRVLITHQLQYLNMVDNIVILNHVSVSHHIKPSK
jgi:ABC-type transport system involved in cytochrome bd biosynthesis fused ATPase/permease subunit